MQRTAIDIREADYQAARDFITRKTGLFFQDSKREDLQTVLQDRLGVLPRFTSLRSYLAFLENDEDGGREMRALVSLLTVGETYFFRNRQQFTALRDHVLPAIIHRRRGKRQYLRLWSAGCSSGEEAYSLAILLHELLPDIRNWKIHLLASDINEDALLAARDGLYRNWSFREVEERYRQAYFTPEGESSRIRRDVQSMVTFSRINLADGLFPSVLSGTDEMDLILCRNVMIYFRPELSREITRRFFLCLEDQGALLVGHSEHSDLVYPGFSRRFYGHAIVYQKKGPNPVWERRLAIRFRGSGPLPRGIVTHEPPAARPPGVQRPAGTEETVVFERGALLVSERRPVEAIAEFRRVLQVNPTNERALYSIAMLLADIGNSAEAAATAERLVQLNPLHLEATYLLALLARETGRAENELALLKRTVYLNPDFVLGHFQMGLHYLRVANSRQARRSLLNAQRLLQSREGADLIEGVEGMTVGRLLETMAGLMPGASPEGGG